MSGEKNSENFLPVMTFFFRATENVHVAPHVLAKFFATLFVAVSANPHLVTPKKTGKSQPVRKSGKTDREIKTKMEKEKEKEGHESEDCERKKRARGKGGRAFGGRYRRNKLRSDRQRASGRYVYRIVSAANGRTINVARICDWISPSNGDKLS